ncbi:MAG: NADH:flavin oxidoreductase [Jatrophihabitans sp.]|uniref:NADH:flavin oxidoreductase n=1 Tax=Jatrophihabitans sp. TaxID=1932789 RepID=UPI003F7E886C
MTPDPFAPARLGPITLRNRTIKAATFEGRAPKGLVSDELIDFHRTMAVGGVGMTTVAYLAVAPEGRTERRQIHWRDEAMPGLRRLTDAVHAEGAAISAQIGHAGPVADGRSNRLPVLSPSRMISPLAMMPTKAATIADLQRITAAHADAARRAIEAGFDAVEVHLGHNYLASAFLSPRLNRRRDGYGGSLENRARFPREIMRAVRDAVGDRIAVLAKLNMDDGVKRGFGLAEAVQVARWLEADGSLDALEMTAGSSLLNPMYLFKGPAPLKEFAAQMREPVRTGIRIFGRTRLHSYPYTDAYLLEDAKRVRAAVSLPMILLGGVTNRAVIDKALAEGFEFVAMGRALLAEPDLVRRMQADAAVASKCIHCNRCMPTIYVGSHCKQFGTFAPARAAASR